MNEQERDVIADMFRRLEKVAGEPRDPEAERFIEDRIRQQPYAPYAMAQALFIQEQALRNLQAEAEQLREEVARVQRQSQGSSGILGSLFGGGKAPAQEASPSPQPSAAWGGGSRVGPGASRSVPGIGGVRGQGTRGPWGGAAAPAGGGGFLQGALSTAAGVAGGVMIANALTSAFGGKSSPEAGGEKAALADTSSADAPGDTASVTDALYETDAETGPYDDFADDSGDLGDWA